MWSAAEALSLRLDSGESGPNPFRDSRLLKFSDGREDVHLQLAGWRCRVDALGERYKRNPKRLDFLK